MVLLNTCWWLGSWNRCFFFRTRTAKRDVCLVQLDLRILLQNFAKETGFRCLLLLSFNRWAGANRQCNVFLWSIIPSSFLGFEILCRYWNLAVYCLVMFFCFVLFWRLGAELTSGHLNLKNFSTTKNHGLIKQYLIEQLFHLRLMDVIR